MTPRRMNRLLRVLLIAFIGIGVVGLYFANQKLTGIAKETAKLKADVSIGQQQLVAYQKTKDQVDALSYVSDLANKVLPADKDQSAIVAEVSEFALRSGVTISQINFSDVAKPASSGVKKSLVIPKGVSVIPVTVQLQAGAKYDNLLTFLKTLEDNRRKSQVTNITLTPDGKDRTRLSQVTIAFNLYTQKGDSGGVK